MVITFDNGARAVAEASFSAAYGYDVRARGVRLGAAWSPPGTVPGAARGCTPRPAPQHETARGDVEMLLDAYTAEFVEFTAAVEEKRSAYATGRDARRALAIALACIDSVQNHAPVAVDRRAGRTVAR